MYFFGKPLQDVTGNAKLLNEMLLDVTQMVKQNAMKRLRFMSGPSMRTLPQTAAASLALAQEGLSPPKTPSNKVL